MLFADILNTKEYNFSLEAGSDLKNVIWAQEMLKDKKIVRALNGKVPHDAEDIRAVKASLVEVRFAYAIHNCGFKAEHEFKARADNTSIDFRVFNPNKPEDPQFLIELTSLKTSAAAVENTTISGNRFITSSTTKPCDETNSFEVRDLKKVQDAIFNKVSKEAKSVGDFIEIKFPEKSNRNVFSVVVVDMRGYLNNYGQAGESIEADCHNIVYGSYGLPDQDKRDWIVDGRKAPFIGVFDPSHPDPRSESLQNRVHAIGFINESKFIDSEIRDNLLLYINPNLSDAEAETIKRSWLFQKPA